ncbi:MAG TPA: bacterial proteasome activator family protein [Ornithinibacter sp.]|nr:bacterial proteasome activator family protein [Ornithinibacter sp.]
MTEQASPGNDRRDESADDDNATYAAVNVDSDRVVVVTEDGMGVARHDDPPREPQRPTNPADLVEQPAKVMRIGSMIKQLLEEVRSAPLDERGRARLAEIHGRSIAELKDGLAPELVEELERIALPFSDDAPSDAELRIAQAQLVGWLEGLFHGIQTALVAQQMAAQAQLQQMRALPPGASHPAGPPPSGGAPGQHLPRPDGTPGHAEGTGQYL